MSRKDNNKEENQACEYTAPAGSKAQPEDTSAICGGVDASLFETTGTMPNKGKGVHLFVGASAVADPFPTRMARLLGWFETHPAFIFPGCVMGLTEVIAHLAMAHVATAMPWRPWRPTRAHMHR